MDSLKEQALACIRQSGLHYMVDDLIRLLRYSIRLHVKAASEQSLEVGRSKIGGTPDLPPDIAWPEYQGRPLPFYAQIRCADLIASDLDGLLPRTGWLYFFYDVLADTYPSNADTWRVLYIPDEASPLQRTATPASLSDDERYGCCEVTFSLAMMLPELGSYELEDFGLSWGGGDPDSKEWRQYQDLLDQLADLSPGTEYNGLSLLGYPDEDGTRMQRECEQHSLTLGWHNRSLTKSEWFLLLQIDVNEATKRGAAHMEKGDWLAIYFWIRQDTLARRDFERVWLLVNSD